MPERFHRYLYLWPPTPIIEFSRAVLVAGTIPTARAHLFLAVDAATILLVGALIFRRFSPRAAEYVCRHGRDRSRLGLESVPSANGSPGYDPRARARLLAAATIPATAGARLRRIRAPQRRDAGPDGAQRLGQEHAAQDRVRHLPARP